MKQKSVPGYTMFFGEALQPYEKYVKNFSSWNILLWAANINNELYASLDFHDNQLRLLKMLSRGYTKQQNEFFEQRLKHLAQSGFGIDAFHIFHKRYLLPLIVKELKRNNTVATYQPANGAEFSLLMAYLMVIDEEHEIDRKFLEKSKFTIDKADHEYNIIWTNILRQFHYNEPASPLIELCKLYVLCKYAHETWPENFKTHLENYGVHTIGQLAKGYVDIVSFLYFENPLGQYRKKGDLVPADGTNKKHLTLLSINELFGEKDASLADLRKRPLYSFPDGRYRVFDPNFLYKHIYRGTYFDLYHKTSLSKQLPNFNDYSNEVSKKVLEGLFFRTTMQSLQSPADKLITDRKEDYAPDAYIRMDDTILLIEFKAYVVNDKHIAKPDFKAFKKYIEENFIRKTSGRGKGAGQIIEQIKLLCKGSLNEDISLSEVEMKTFHIYPIICHNDFLFGMTALNDYINKRFLEEIKKEQPNAHVIVHDLTLINLDWMVDLYLRGGNFASLTRMIYAYHQILEDRKRKLPNETNSEAYLNSRSSFDEIYKHLFIQSLPDIAENKEAFSRFLDRLGFTDEILSHTIT